MSLASRGISQGQLSEGTCPERKYSRKSFKEQMSSGQLFWANFIGLNCLEGNFPGGNYSGVMVRRAKVWRVMKLILFSAGFGIIMIISA